LLVGTSSNGWRSRAPLPDAFVRLGAKGIGDVPITGARTRRQQQMPIEHGQEAGCRSPDSDWTHFCDRRIDSQLARLDQDAPGPASTAALAAKIDREVTDEAPLIPLFAPRLPDITSKRVGDYEEHGGFVLLDQLWVH
jgi:ABC-type transport system substrate-binding protein